MNTFFQGISRIDEPHDVMFETLGQVTRALPDDRPRYLMGVGNPTTLVRAVREGVDMFDCVLGYNNAIETFPGNIVAGSKFTVRRGFEIEDAAAAELAVSELMGELVEPRKEFIQKHARDVRFRPNPLRSGCRCQTRSHSFVRYPGTARRGHVFE